MTAWQIIADIGLGQLAQLGIEGDVKRPSQIFSVDTVTVVEGKHAEVGKMSV